MSEKYSIRLNEPAHRFELPLEERLAIAEFERFPGGIAYTHTLVPHALEGRGVGSALVKHALDYAEHEHLKVRPVCSFVRTYIERHPWYRPLLEEGDGAT